VQESASGLPPIDGRPHGITIGVSTTFVVAAFVAAFWAFVAVRTSALRQEKASLAPNTDVLETWAV
jgi:hypothetical protein